MVHQQPSVTLVIAMSDGTVAVMTFLTESRAPSLPDGAMWLDQQSGLWRRQPTADNIASEMKKAFPPVDQLGQSKPQPVSYKIVKPGDVPSDRTFRNAWRHDSQRVVHDMPTAREIHRARLRRARVSKLAELDIAYQRADEQNDQESKKKIAAQKQMLRDVTTHPGIDAAMDPESLKAFWPEELT